MLFQRALVAVDFSPATDPMLDCLPELTRLGTRELVLVYVLDIGYPRGPETGHIEHYKQRMEEKKVLLETQGLAVRAEIRVGYPAAEILAAAQEYDASVVVVGSHGHGPVGDVLLGGVAREIIHRSSMPVLVIRLVAGEPGPRLACPTLTTHILAAVDLSSDVDRLFSRVEEIARSGAGRITLVHVRDVRSTEDADRTTQSLLDELAERLREKGASEVRSVILHGSPAEEIMKWADANQVTMLVVGSHSRGILSDLLLGSVSHDIIRNSRLPVLLIPAARR